MPTTPLTTAASTSAPHFEYLDFSDELKCSICLEPLDDAVELSPCKHMFCRHCCANLQRCPECRADIRARNEPNRAIKNMLSELPVMCSQCGWKGTRESKRTHTACSANAAAAAPGAGGSAARPTPSRFGAGPAAVAGGGSAASPPPFAMQMAPPPMDPAPHGYYAAPPPQQGRPQQPPPPPPPPYAPVSGYGPSYNQYYNAWPQPPQAPYGYPTPPPPGGVGGPQFGYPGQQPAQYGAPPPIPQQQQPSGSHPPRVPPRVISSNGHPEPWKLYGLSQMDYDQIFAIFLTFDEDGSGALDREELTKLARWLNFAQQQGDIDRMFREMDTDRDGTLTLDEFCTWLMVNKPDPTALYGLTQSEYNTIMFQFRQFDRNQDGCLNLEEFQQLCHTLKYANPQQAISIFRAIDLDHNGTVDLNEFLQYRAREQQQQQRR